MVTLVMENDSSYVCTMHAQRMSSGYATLAVFETWFVGAGSV